MRNLFQNKNFNPISFLHGGLSNDNDLNIRVTNRHRQLYKNNFEALYVLFQMQLVQNISKVH